MSGLSLRRLTGADAALFRDIRLEALREEPAAFCAALDVEAAEPLEKFAARLERSAVFGAFEGTAIIGMAGFTLSTMVAGRGILWGMYVKKSAQGKGVGGALVQAVIRHARDHVSELRLGVIEANQSARQLYRKQGFAETGLDERVLETGRPIREVGMALKL